MPNPARADSEDDEGESTSPKNVNSDSDSEEDGEDEPTEADKRFVVDDDDDDDGNQEKGDENEDEEPQRKKHKRRKRTVREDDEEEDLDDDDRELMQENLGIQPQQRKYKRLRKKDDEDTGRRRAPMDLGDALFNDDDDMEDRDDDRYGRDDLIVDDEEENFVVDDQEDDDDDVGQRRIEQKARRRQTYELAQNFGADLGIQDIGEAWETIQEVFGDGTDYEWAMVHDDDELADGLEDRVKAVQLEDVYEPAALEARMMTKKDKDIRELDVPERFQERGNFRPLSEEELSYRPLLIAQDLLRRNRSQEDGALLTLDHPLVAAVKHVIRFLRADNFLYEVPFIFHHRKDYFDGHLNRLDLWTIYDLDHQRALLENRKLSLRKLFDEIIRMSPEARDDEPCEEALQEAESAGTMDDVLDLYQYIQLHYFKEIQQIEASKSDTFKRPIRKTSYEVAMIAGISEFVKLFGVNVPLFSKCFTTAVDEHFPDDVLEEPMIAASRFVSSQYPNPENVLEAAREILADRIAVDPKFRSFLRRVYETDAVITTFPTEKGKSELDQSHPHYQFKYLKEKPVYTFSGAEVLQMLNLEDLKLITIEVRVDAQDKLLEDIFKHITNDGTSVWAEYWNRERTMAADTAMRTLLFPAMAKWVKEKLAADAVIEVGEVCRSRFEQEVDMAGWVGQDNDDAPVVVSLSWGDGQRNSPCYGVVLNPYGEMVDNIRLDQMGDPNPDVRAKAQGMLLDFILDNKPKHDPYIIVIGGTTVTTKTRLLPDIQTVLDRAPDGDVRKMPVMIVDDAVARIFMNSKRGLAEFPEGEYPELVRYCVSLGRKVQDPTMEYAGLFNENEEYKALSIHSLQYLLPEDKLKLNLERALINVVSNCGVDINKAVAYPHHRHTLQFVAGLGPRKANGLITTISRQGGTLKNRGYLIKECGMGIKIFMNCASFIRIREQHFKRGRHEEGLDILDDTRIHPEDYDLARKMAADALEVDDAYDDEENPSVHVREIIEGEIRRLDDLLLEDYALELERRIHTPKKIALTNIRDEMKGPYRERRKRFSPATSDQIFTMLIGDTPESLMNSVVTVEIVKVFPRIVKVRLPSGLDGIIQARYLDDSMVISPFDVVSEGQVLQARVNNIDREKFTCELTAKPSEVIRRVESKEQSKYFDEDRERRDLENRNAEIQRTRARQTRVVQHPCFQSINYLQAINFLAGKPRGEFVIRPSTKGNDHLSITWKVEEGIYDHIDVLEKDKDNDWALGRRLYIRNVEYSALDEIIARYIDPMSRFVSDIIDHPKYHRGSKADLLQQIPNLVQRQKRTYYAFVLNAQKPGCFDLVYMHPKARAQEDLVTVKPEGFEFRRKTFQRVDDMIDYFKKDEMRRMQAPPSTSSRNRPPPNQSAQRPPVQDPRSVRGAMQRA
ncbi:SH2 domain-containing protein [Cladochytrium replicatum]|nr:SH2 domain-containing protein [Cladochytrium replicatum]